MLVKRILFFLIFAAVLLPQASSAQIDQRCWKRDQCEKARAEMGLHPGQAADGFYQGADTRAACGEKDAAGNELGFCLPGGSTVTNISFGGKREFSNIGEFISDMFQYSIIVAGILAVIMIIIAGFQWTMSGGSPERIGSAKKRIGGAVIGLVIAVLSFTILNTINPNLVNIRLPQTWMVNTQGIAPPFCAQIIGNKLAALGPTSKPMTPADKEKKIEQATYTIEPAQAACGTDYLVNGTGGQTCTGTLCPSANTVCVNSACVKGKIAGKIYNSSLIKKYFPDVFTEQWGDDLIDGAETEIWAICNEEEYEEVSGVNSYLTATGDAHFYNVIAEDTDIIEAIKECGGSVKGFALVMEMDEATDPTDEDHMIGRRPNGDAVDLGEWNAVPSNIKHIVSTGKENSYFISQKQMLDGFSFNIDISVIMDIDDDDDALKAYKEFEYKP